MNNKFVKSLILTVLAISIVNSKFCSTYTSASKLFYSSYLNKVTPTPYDCGGFSCETYVWGSYFNRVFVG